MATLGRSPGAAPLTSADIPDDSITGAKIVDDALDSEHYTAGSVDAAHVAADVATQAEINLKAPLASPVLVTPNLGTPSAGTLTSCTFPSGHVLETQLESITAGTYQGVTFSNLQLGSTITVSSVGAGETIVAWALGGGLVYKHSNKSSMNSTASIGIGASGDEEITYGASGSTGGGSASHDIDVLGPGATTAVREYAGSASDVLIKLYIKATTAGGWQASATSRIYLHVQRIKGTVL